MLSPEQGHCSVVRIIQGEAVFRWNARKAAVRTIGHFIVCEQLGDISLCGSGHGILRACCQDQMIVWHQCVAFNHHLLCSPGNFKWERTV